MTINMVVITTHNKATKEVGFWDKEPIKVKSLKIGKREKGFAT
jgi:hypothetical protein